MFGHTAIMRIPSMNVGPTDQEGGSGLNDDPHSPSVETFAYIVLASMNDDRDVGARSPAEEAAAFDSIKSVDPANMCHSSSCSICLGSLLLPTSSSLPSL
jgi:hypothetical protein